MHSIVLGDARAAYAEIITYGATLTKLVVPDRNDRFQNVVLGFGSVAEYAGSSAYFGATIGRFANRISEGRFTWNGRTYHLTRNDGPNTLHGGAEGFDRKLWTIVDSSADELTLAYDSPDGEEGFPGALAVSVRFSFTASRGLGIAYRATALRDTIVNLTNHSYFNLAGEGEGPVLDHLLWIDAEAFTPVREGLIPTGAYAEVAGTPFDFRTAMTIGSRIHARDDQLVLAGGYDHNWVLRGGPTSAPRAVATLYDSRSGRGMEIRTTEPGLQVYTGNRLSAAVQGVSGRPYGTHHGIALETQHFPDSPNHPGFPSTVLRAGETFRSETQWGFFTAVSP